MTRQDMDSWDPTNWQMVADIDADGADDVIHISNIDTGAVLGGEVRLFFAASRTGEFMGRDEADGLILAERDEDGFAYGDEDRNRTAVADFNGDGYADIAAGAHQQDFTASGIVYIFSGEDLGVGEMSAGDAMATLETDVPGAEAVEQLWVSNDLDHDGSPELFVMGDIESDSWAGGTIRIFSGAELVSSGVRDILGPDATWSPPEEDETCTSRTGASSYVTANLGDLNGDGWSDVMLGFSPWDCRKTWLLTGIEY